MGRATHNERHRLSSNVLAVEVNVSLAFPQPRLKVCTALLLPAGPGARPHKGAVLKVGAVVPGSADKDRHSWSTSDHPRSVSGLARTHVWQASGRLCGRVIVAIAACRHPPPARIHPHVEVWVVTTCADAPYMPQGSGPTVLTTSWVPKE